MEFGVSDAFVAGDRHHGFRVAGLQRVLVGGAATEVVRTGGSFTSDLAADPHDFRGGAAYQHTLKPGDTKAVMPISSDERVTYPELQQNPGYKD